MPVTALRSGLDARYNFQAVHVGLSGRVVFCSRLLTAAPLNDGGTR
ncbi:hypothetical protein LMG24235_01461 [Paraburkholderia sabiae]|jgi:hypothetical protein|nr:hypothetical protein LMG24235_01461 [Paraburkholderia sabiae]CAG9237732.1 conserved hypothetical protein [Paraburkholderia sabiae]